MGAKSSKNTAIKYYHQYIDHQSQKSYQKHDEISSKLMSSQTTSKINRNIFSPSENCITLCLENMELPNVH